MLPCPVVSHRNGICQNVPHAVGSMCGDWEYVCYRVRLFPIVSAFVKICHTRLVQCVAVWNLHVAGFWLFPDACHCIPNRAGLFLIMCRFCSFLTNCLRSCGIISHSIYAGVALPHNSMGFSPTIKMFGLKPPAVRRIFTRHKCRA